MIYANSIDESKLGRIDRNLKRVGKGIKTNIVSGSTFQVKMNIGVLRQNLRRAVFLKVVSLHVLLQGRGTMGNS